MNSPQHLLVMNTLCYSLDYPLEKLLIVKIVAKVVYLIHEASQKKCIPDLLGRHDHDVMAINDIETFRVSFMLLSLVVRLYS